MTDKTLTPPAVTPVPTKLNEQELAAKVLVDQEATKEAAATEGLKLGDNVLVSGTLAGQVNALTAQPIPHASPVIAKYDRWIEIQLGAEVLTRHKL